MKDDIVTRLTMFSLDDGTNALNQLLGDAADEIERLRKVEADRDMWRNALLHGVANLDNQCAGCEICEFIKSKHEEVGGMR